MHRIGRPSSVFRLAKYSVSSNRVSTASGGRVAVLAAQPGRNQLGQMARILGGSIEHRVPCRAIGFARLGIVGPRTIGKRPRHVKADVGVVVSGQWLVTSEELCTTTAGTPNPRV